MKLLGDSLAHAMHLATAARTGLLIVGQVILDPLTRQVRRQRSAAALLSRCAFDGWQARVRKFGDIVRFAAGIILVGGLLGFIEQTVDVLFAARRKTMQACQRQFFLEPNDALRELTILHLQRSNARQQRFDTRFAGSIHRILESGRGLKGVQLVISDACRGLLESVADFLPEARYQRCMVHFYRNVFSHVPSTRVREVSHMLKAIHAQESREAADTKAKAIVDDLRASKMSKAADLVEQAVHETLTYYGFPDIHWQKIRTNNPLERIMKEIRRRTRVVGAFPDGQSCLNLAAARLRHIAGTTWSAKCYMNMRPLYQQQISETEAVA